MMKAALTYYRESKQEQPRNLTLGQLNAGNALRLRVRKKKQTPKVEFTPAEKALLRMVKSGHIGSYIAHHAPQPGPVED